MNLLTWQTVAQVSVERILNALPEGMLIALFAWVLLRVLRKQNSGTRFAVWFLALLAVAVLPVLGGFGEGRTPTLAGTSWGSMGSAITIPAWWALFVFAAWVFGASVAMVRLAAGFWRLRQMRRSCTPIVAADLDPAVRKTVDAIGAPDAGGSKSITKSITIAMSEYMRVPSAIGFWKRTIILPAWALRELPPHDLNVILLHEFAHLRRGDDWTNLIQKIVRALFFFHPAVWWIENRLSVEREMACDDAVLAETSNPHGYATCLVSLLEKSLAHRLSHQHVGGKRWSMVHAAVSRVGEASLRLARILDKNRPVATRIWKPALGMIGTFSMVCLLTLPHAPQFVAFDRGGDRSMTASNSGHTYAYPYSAAVIPVALRTGATSLVGATEKVVHANLHAKNATGTALPQARAVAVRLNAEPPRERVVEASAGGDQKIVPGVQTLVFIEATQYMTADSSVWSVQVWQVTFVSAVRERLARVPAPKSI